MSLTVRSLGVPLLKRLAAVVLAIAGVARGATAQEALLITGGTVVDVRAGTEHPGQAVLIERGRIVAVGGADSLRQPRARRIDAGGYWIIPGLIDVHAHEADRKVLARALALGVTGALTMPRGGDTLMPLERWSGFPESAMPRLYLVPWMFSGEFPDNLFPGAFPVRKPRSTGEAHKFVEQVHRVGGRHLKVYLEDGELLFEPSAPMPNLSSEVLSEIVQTAHMLGIRVYAHAWKTTFARQAMAAGVDQLIHPVADSVLPKEAWDEIRHRGMPWVSTFLALMAFGDPPEYARRVLADSSLRAVLTAEELAQMTHDTASGACRADLLPVLCRHYDENMETVRRNARAARAAGVQLALGSDWALGVGTQLEMELLAEAGVPAAEVLRAATWGSAHALGASDQVGTIEPGRMADLVILRADPLQDIRNTRRIGRVIKQGHLFEPVALLH